MWLDSFLLSLDWKSILLFLVLFVLIADYVKNRSPHNYPPGPRGLPLIGNFLDSDAKYPHLSFSKLAEIYGNVFSFRFGSDRFVIVCGYQQVKDALMNQGEIFADRPFSPVTDRFYSGTGGGIFMSNGEMWKKHRRFALSTLRSFGLGKSTAEICIREEIQNLQDEIQIHKGPFTPAGLFNNAVSNIICQLVMGKRFEYNDNRFQTMLHLLSETLYLEGTVWAQLYESFPWLMKHVPGPHHKMFQNMDTVFKFISEEVKRHKPDLDPSNPRDYIDAFIIEMQNNKDTDVGFNEANLVYCSMDLFLAGTETTSTTLQWALIHLIKHPEAQEKAQAEIDRVIGQSRLPTMADRANLPYTDAVIHEIQRIGNIVPLNGLRMASKDTTLGGYFIPKLAEIYGNVFSFRFGSDKLVLICGYKMVKEALVNQADVFVDRPFSPTAERSYGGTGGGIFLSNGEKWKKQRRFALSTLRNFGVGKSIMEQCIQEEIQYLQEEILSHKGPFVPGGMFNNAVSNIICQLVMGKRFNYSDDKFQTLLHILSEALYLEGTVWRQLYDSFPWLMKHLPGPHNTMFKNNEMIHEFISEEVTRHKPDLDPSNPRDYIDAFLIEMQNHKDPEEGFNEVNLAYCSMDLFFAGTETTSTTLQWALIYLIKHPEVQEKAQAEIDAVIGQSRLPTMADRVNLPYTDAVIHEIQRIGNIVPLNGLRMASKDITLGGYFIPKGTKILPMLHSVLFDKTQWETPDTFNPGHFLDKDGKFMKREALLPFSAGKRVCLGEGLAKMELFLFIVGLLQKFSFFVPDGVELRMDGITGDTRVPHPFQVHAKVR